jgi:imidazolonepropionase-like amidohydrolase
MPTHLRTLISNTTVFDGTRFVPEVSVLFDDETIIAIGSDLSVPHDCSVIEGRDHTLLPGLIDAHVHTPSRLAFAEPALRCAVVFGVTTVIDLGAEPSVITTMKAKAAVSHDIADLLSAGVLATAPGGHPLELGGELPTLRRPEEAAGFVAARIAEGSDFLKIVLEDGTTYGIESPHLDYPVVEALTKAAHDADLLVVAHAAGQAFARWAIQAGVDVLAHAVVDEPPAADVVSALSRSRTAVMSTLTVFEASEQHQLWKDPRVATHLEPSFLERLGEHVPSDHRPRTQIDHGLQAIREYHRSGIPILAGTDAPNPGTAPGASLHRELPLLTAAGLTAAEALTAATSRPAEVFGLHDRGRIEEGLRPDLVLVEGNVEHDISSTLNILNVWRGGIRVARKR